MKSIIFIVSLFYFATCVAQEPLSKENGKIIIDIYSIGYQTGDTLKMKSVMHPYITIQTAYLNKDQENLFLNIKASELMKYASATAKEQQWSEKLKDYIVNSDGNIAHVWSSYDFYANGKFSHCGAKSFSMVYTDESWKIVNVIDSRRIASCNP